MHPRRVAFVLVATGMVLAVGSVVAFPHAGEPRTTYEVQKIPGADGAVEYEELTPDARDAFQEALDNSYTAYGDAPFSPNASIEYQNATYRVTATVTEYDRSWTLERGIPFALSTLLGGAGLVLFTARE